MLKILNKIEFSKEENKMKSIGNVETAIKLFKESKSKNLKFLLKKRILIVSASTKMSSVTP